MAASAMAALSRSGDTGFVRWRLKPASRARDRSSAWPYPVRAMRRIDRPPAPADASGDLVAVESRQPDIDHDDLGADSSGHVHARDAVGRLVHLVPLLRQLDPQNLAGIIVVHDNQDAPRTRSGRAEPRGRRRRGTRGNAW